MRFSESFLDEIRARLPASEIVGRRVKLKKQGREFAGLSPFNAEKTASFFVNDQKARWFDFSAGKSGDIFTFVMDTEGLGFPEAVERLAGEAGVAMPARDEREEERERQRASLHDVTEIAAAFFEARLQASNGASARGYLIARDIGPELQMQFRIGYAPPGRNELKQHLADKGVDQQRMAEAGLLITGDDVPVSFDRFRDRVIFPITNARGRVVGFGGRALSADVPAKYLNSPETELFHKGSLLYNIGEARTAAHRDGTVNVVEGYADVIQMAGAGFANTVAPLGTALTERQLGLLWRMADEPVLCFDGDKAGRRAAYRAVDLALPHLAPGKSLRFAMLPAGEDPDDLIRRSGRGPMEAVLQQAAPLIDILWSRETEGETFQTPEQRAALEARLAECARLVGDEVVRRHYLQALKERIETFFGYGRRGERTGTDSRRRNRPWKRGGDARDTGRYEKPPVSDRLKSSTLLQEKSSFGLRDAVLLATMVNHPALIADHLDAFCDIDFAYDELNRLRGAVMESVAVDPSISAEGLSRQLEQRHFGAILAALTTRIQGAGFWPATKKAGDEDAASAWRQALALHQRNRTLNRELREAEVALAGEPNDRNLARMVDIQNQLANQQGTEALIEGFGAGSGRSAPVF
ncbi:MAG: DNA primase [Alphaproteobacteria bacterium]